VAPSVGWRPSYRPRYSDIIKYTYFPGASARRGQLEVLLGGRRVLEPGNLLAFPAAGRIPNCRAAPLLSQPEKGISAAKWVFIGGQGLPAM